MGTDILGSAVREGQSTGVLLKPGEVKTIFSNDTVVPQLITSLEKIAAGLPTPPTSIDIAMITFTELNGADYKNLTDADKAVLREVFASFIRARSQVIDTELAADAQTRKMNAGQLYMGIAIALGTQLKEGSADKKRLQDVLFKLSGAFMTAIDTPKATPPKTETRPGTLPPPVATKPQGPIITDAVLKMYQAVGTARMHNSLSHKDVRDAVDIILDKIEASLPTEAMIPKDTSTEDRAMMLSIAAATRRDISALRDYVKKEFARTPHDEPKVLSGFLDRFQGVVAQDLPALAMWLPKGDPALGRYREEVLALSNVLQSDAVKQAIGTLGETESGPGARKILFSVICIFLLAIVVALAVLCVLQVMFKFEVFDTNKSFFLFTKGAGYLKSLINTDAYKRAMAGSRFDALTKIVGSLETAGTAAIKGTLEIRQVVDGDKPIDQPLIPVNPAPTPVTPVDPPVTPVTPTPEPVQPTA